MPMKELKAFQPICDRCGTIGPIWVRKSAKVRWEALPDGWVQHWQTIRVLGVGTILQAAAVECDECTVWRAMMSKEREFARDIKSLAALDEGFESITPWTQSNQVVGTVCNRLSELASTPGMTEVESTLAQNAAGAIHAVCVVLDDLEESWADRHEPQEDAQVRD